MRSSVYPVVDIFAGPGGLGEGFSSLTNDRNQARFKSVASIEKEEFSHRTLLLRHFVRSFPNREIPDDYYRYLSGNIGVSELFSRHNVAFAKAQECALRICLGSENHATVKHLVTNRLADAKRWVLVGGPPCQAYSLVGRSRMMGTPGFEEDERHFLYKEYLRIIVDHKPPIFVMENVKGLLSSKIKDQLIIRRIVSDLSRPSAAVKEGRNDLSYRLYSLCHAEPISENDDPRLFIVKAEQHGVPQARHRMFIVGLRADINARPNQLRRQRPPTVSQTIGDLPKIRSGLSKATDSFNSWQQAIAELALPSIHPQLDDGPFAKQVFERVRLSISSDGLPESRFSTAYPTNTNAGHDTLRSLRDDRLSVLIGHNSRAHMESDLRRYMYASAFAQVTGRSPKLGDLPASLLPNHSNIGLGRIGKMFSDRFRVQLPNRVSTTITSHISKDGHYFIHYDPLQCRSLTVREAARLQTFPDNYKFEGPRTAQYHQVGNAVPPYLAVQIAEIIVDLLDSMGTKD